MDPEAKALIVGKIGSVDGFVRFLFDTQLDFFASVAKCIVRRKGRMFQLECFILLFF